MVTEGAGELRLQGHLLLGQRLRFGLPASHGLQGGGEPSRTGREAPLTPDALLSVPSVPERFLMFQSQLLGSKKREK